MVLGAFLAVDPQGQFASPYLAFGNNPVNFIDPDGELAWFVPLIIGAVIGGTTGGVIANNNGIDWWKGAITGAFIGASIGALVAPGLGAAGIVAAGYNVQTFGWTFATSAINGGTFNAGINLATGGEAWRGALSGAVYSAASAGFSIGGAALFKNAGNAYKTGFAKLGYQAFSTSSSSVIGNLAAGNKWNEQIRLGVGPFSLTFREGKLSKNIFDNLNNIAYLGGNILGIKESIAGRANPVWDKGNLSLDYEPLSYKEKLSKTGSAITKLPIDRYIREKYRADGVNLFGVSYRYSSVRVHENIHTLFRRIGQDSAQKALFSLFNPRIVISKYL